MVLNSFVFATKKAQQLSPVKRLIFGILFLANDYYFDVKMYNRQPTSSFGPFRWLSSTFSPQRHCYCYLSSPSFIHHAAHPNPTLKTEVTTFSYFQTELSLPSGCLIVLGLLHKSVEVYEKVLTDFQLSFNSIFWVGGPITLSQKTGYVFVQFYSTGA